MFFLFANPCHAIKIGLQTGVSEAAVGTSVKGALFDAATGRLICNLDAMKGYLLQPYRDTIAIRINDTFYKLKSDSIIIRPETSGFTSAKGKWYRGSVIVRNVQGKLTVINDVELEDYLKGVVPVEMSPSWHEEALKAQAIAARSYAMANLGKRTALGFDLFDTPDDQAYRGASAETAKTNTLVDETRGIVLTHDMKIVNAYYSASAGGRSKNAEDVWGGSLPYIHSVPSYDSNVKKMGHGVGMSQHGANNLAKSGHSAFAILQYFYNNVKFARIKQTNG